MLFKSTVGIGAIALSVGVSGCNRPAQETRDDAKETAAQVRTPRPTPSSSVTPK